MASLHCIASCFPLTAKLSNLSLNPSSSSRSKFRSVGFSSTVSINGFSKGCLWKGRAQAPRRLSVVCEATAPTKKGDSAEKRARQNVKRRLINRAKRSELRTRMKTVLLALEKLRKNKEAKVEEILEIEKLIAVAYKAIDKAVRGGAMKRNTGNHRKSRLARRKRAIMIHHGWYVPGAAAPEEAA